MQEVNGNKENQFKEDKKAQILEHQPKLSIQQAFKRFQKEKFYQLKLNKYLKSVEVDRTSPDFKSHLRKKFIQNAFKYVGVPYSQKFHSEGDPLYNAPLFLDCCGLIRQCIFDLREQFGYTLAKWNQSYQFDLLPNAGLQERDLLPGDLIFYSATYNNLRLKPFPHSMVHVQIYLGDGKSIGARWQKGTIQQFPSYKFESTLYHDIQFHYRSIQSWLQGTFQTHCPQHKWSDERTDWTGDRFSVFADPTLADLSPDLTPKNSKPVFVGKGNNSRLVRNYFSTKQDYCLMQDKDNFSAHYYMKWVQTTGEVDFYSFQEGTQVVNHIANICIISGKVQLLKTLQEWARDNQSTSLLQFIPKTYRLDVMSDEIEFLNDQSSALWIYKPRNLNQGKGIRIIADVDNFKKAFIRSKKFYLGQYAMNNMLQYKPELDPQLTHSQEKYSQLKHDGLMQHYIQPLLLTQKKFDIRCYMLVNAEPSIVLFNKGYLRLTLQNYSQEAVEKEQNLLIHLTNNCFQNKHPAYKQKKDSTIAEWTLLQQEVGGEKCQQIMHRMKIILLTVFYAAQKKLVAKRGQYELLGCDILIDRNCNPFLLEVNTNPAMFTETIVQKKLLPTLMNNTLDLILSIFQQGTATHIAADPNKYGFDLLYCKETNYTYK